jgi:hypothetical protein
VASAGNIDKQSVFLNVPFDKGYERLFVALVAALVSIGRTPRSVLEIAEIGQGRLYRIQQLIAHCRVSIHDLSRVGLPVRFNMPFELGLACSLATQRKVHDYLILERVPHRLDKTLSDMKGKDPYIHYGSARGIVNCVLDALGVPGGNPQPRRVFRLSGSLWRVAGILKAKAGRKTIYSRVVFLQLVEAAVELALREGLLEA